MVYQMSLIETETSAPVTNVLPLESLLSPLKHLKPIHKLIGSEYWLNLKILNFSHVNAPLGLRKL